MPRAEVGTGREAISGMSDGCSTALTGLPPCSEITLGIDPLPKLSPYGVGAERLGRGSSFI
jgi:hypothetical protein